MVGEAQYRLSDGAIPLGGYRQLPTGTVDFVPLGQIDVSFHPGGNRFEQSRARPSPVKNTPLALDGALANRSGHGNINLGTAAGGSLLRTSFFPILPKAYGSGPNRSFWKRGSLAKTAVRPQSKSLPPDASIEFNEIANTSGRLVLQTYSWQLPKSLIGLYKNR